MAGTGPSRIRRIAFTICVALFVLGYGLLFSLILGLLGPAWDAGGSEFIHRIHHVGAAVFIGLLLIGLVAQLRAPEQHIAAFQQATVAIIAWVMTNLIVGNPDNHGGNVGIIDPATLIFVVPIIILAALHPARRELLRVGTHVRLASSTIASLGAIPFVIYAIDQALVQRNSWPPAADPHHNGHWMAMAMMAFAIALIGLLAAIKKSGRRFTGWSAGMAAIIFGVTSVLMPEMASSVGRAWGIMSIVGGIGFMGVIGWETKQDQLARLSTRSWQLTRE